MKHMQGNIVNNNSTTIILLDMPEKLVGEMLSASQEKKQTRLHEREVTRT